MVVKRIRYLNGQTAGDVILRLFELHKVDARCNYKVSEFSKEETIDINGIEVPAPDFSISGSSLSELCLDYKKSGKNSRLYIEWCIAIERSILAPAMERPDKFPFNEIKLVDIDEIAEELNRFRKKARHELKCLRSIYNGATETQNPGTIGALSVLSWLFNNGTARDLSCVLDEFFRLKVIAGKDALFYISRHPRQRSLHRCQDVELLSKLDIFDWALKGKCEISILLLGSMLSSTGVGLKPHRNW